ncbi:MAG: DUF4783 domain-containing protein [bacterium]|nr:DUF4783 domain-containing protein [bacterium]
MKIALISLYFMFGLSFPLIDVGEEIAAALRLGKASELVKYFDEKVSIKILNQEDVLSKSQAEANIKYFFEKHPVKSFSDAHKSSMNSTSQYITGTLETTNGKFRISILIRHELVSQFRIESDND